MSKKNEFLALAAHRGYDGVDFEKWRKTVDLKAFTEHLNRDLELRVAFREAVEEAEEEKRNPAAGLANLFAGV